MICAEPVRSVPEPREGLLQDVLGEGMISEDSHGHRPDRPAIAMKQLLERPLVPPGDACHEDDVVSLAVAVSSTRCGHATDAMSPPDLSIPGPGHNGSITGGG